MPADEVPPSLAIFSREEHEGFLRQAIELGRLGGLELRTGGPFGAVVVNGQGQVVGQGFNKVVATHDPTAHAEMEAIRDACRGQQRFKLSGMIIYCSSEPCPMCLAACYWAGLSAIIYASTMEDAREYGGFDDANFFSQLEREPARRQIPQLRMLREEAVAVWERYASQPGNVPY